VISELLNGCFQVKSTPQFSRSGSGSRLRFGNVLCLEQTLEDMKGMALVCGIPHERFSELYWKLRPPYDRGDIDGPAYWTAMVGQQELGLSRDQVATLIKLDSESITRPNQGAVQWAKPIRHPCPELWPLSPIKFTVQLNKSAPGSDGVRLMQQRSLQQVDVFPRLKHLPT
jgi:hypothetical protein